jgi:hypothetical protein
MKPCSQCQQQNQDDSKFCYQCGNQLAAEAEPTIAAPRIQSETHPDEHLWRQFIGPHADRYLTHFRKFGLGQTPKFALTWNWPAFLYISFLWFLYRKMYTYALVYAVGPMVSTYLTGDMTVGLIWSIMAGATANYVYYWHCREHIEHRARSGEARRSIEEFRWCPVLCNLDRSCLVSIVCNHHVQNGSGRATGRRTITRKTRKALRNQQRVTPDKDTSA